MWAVKYSWHEPVGQFSTKKAAEAYAKLMRASGSHPVTVIRSNPSQGVKLIRGRIYDVSALEFIGWTRGDGTSTTGYNAWDYFDSNGRFLGADRHRIVPIFRRLRANASPFAKCVSSVKKHGGAAAPRAVCAAAGRAKYGQAEMTRRSVAGKKAKARKGNPPEAAVEAYEDFHGRQPDEMVKVTKTIHYHKNLAGAGKLEKLEVISRRGDKVILSGFKGALLAFNEKRTQLFVEGGDQRVDLKQFGVQTVHEMEALGEVKAVEYFTRKDHLGKDGGTAIYRHKFSKPYPELQYDVLNEQLIFSGGSYVIPSEGIDR